MKLRLPQGSTSPKYTRLPNNPELLKELLLRLIEDPRGGHGLNVHSRALLSISILDIRIDEEANQLREMLLRRRRARLITRTHRNGMGGTWLRDQQELEHVLTVAIRALLGVGGEA